MQGINEESKPEKLIRLDGITPEAKQNLVEVFAWLIKEDKKQNPAFYKLTKT